MTNVVESWYGNMPVFVTEFIYFSVHIRNVPSDFGTSIQGELHSFWLGSIKSLSSIQQKADIEEEKEEEREKKS